MRPGSTGRRAEADPPRALAEPDIEVGEQGVDRAAARDLQVVEGAEDGGPAAHGVQVQRLDQVNTAHHLAGGHVLHLRLGGAPATDGAQVEAVNVVPEA